LLFKFDNLRSRFRERFAIADRGNHLADHSATCNRKAQLADTIFPDLTETAGGKPAILGAQPLMCEESLLS
jgi:hypothetical protein